MTDRRYHLQGKLLLNYHTFWSVHGSNHNSVVIIIHAFPGC